MNSCLCLLNLLIHSLWSLHRLRLMTFVLEIEYHGWLGTCINNTESNLSEKGKEVIQGTREQKEQ